MEIISPEFSFLNFGLKEYPECYNIEPMPLPKCGDLAIKAQIEIITDELLPITTPIYVAIADTACNVIEDEDINIAPICSTYKFRTFYTEEPDLPDLGDDNIYNLCYDEGAPIETISSDTNPFDEITSTALKFNISSPFINGIQLYIGKSLNPKSRLRRHIADRNLYDSYKDRWIRKLKENNVRPELIIIFF